MAVSWCAASRSGIVPANMSRVLRAGRGLQGACCKPARCGGSPLFARMAGQIHQGRCDGPNRRRSMLRLSRFALAACACVALSAFAADWPDHAITMIVPFPPGGLADTVGRPVADALSRDLGQPVVIENKSGAGGAIGMGAAAKARPDGYTILMSLSSLTVLPEADKILGRQPQYQIADLKPIARFTADPTVLAVRADAPWKTYQDFIAD